MSLHMVHLPVRLREFMACGRGHRLVSDGWSADLGYLVHAFLARLLAEQAPKPFDVQDAPGTGEALSLDAQRLHVLAYADADHGTLADLARRQGDAQAVDAVDWARAGSKPMPAIAAGQRLGFRTRVCPVVRIGRHHPRFASNAEIDPYLAQVERQLAERELANPGTLSSLLKAEVVAGLPSREAVYQDWLATRLGAAAALEDARLVLMRDARLWRKGQPGDGPTQRMHGHPRARQGARVVIGRREAVFEGTLQVGDAEGFRALLARGVGRHRAFGFGMVLLRPAGDPC